MTGPASVHCRVRPRQVFCPIEPGYRDLRVAAAALAGRFRYAGVSLDLGLPPDWNGGGAPDDEEWHIEWSKFYFGLDLAHAYSVTGDPAYVDAWECLVDSWIEQRGPRADPTDVAARRLQNWLYAWQGFDRAPGFTGLDPGLEQRLLASMGDQLDYVAAELAPERNHRTLELYALLVVSLGLPVLDPDGTRAARAWSDLQDNLLTDVWSDGVHRERSTHYHLIALRSFVAARVNVTRFGGRVPPEYDERLRAACRFGMHLHRPDGQIPALSDSDSGSYLDLLQVAGETLDLPELRYVATQGRRGSPPAERCASFPVGGYYVQRSGWGDRDEPFADERFLVLGAGPLGDGGHGHYDALAVEAYAHGHPLVVDPGRFTYAEGVPNWRHWFKGTAAHNTVTVDGLDQQPYRRGKPKGPRMHSRLLRRLSTVDLHLLHGQVTSPAYDAVHRRAVLFVAGEYWLVVDQLRALSPHDYALRWHLAGDDEPAVRWVGRNRSCVTTTTVNLEMVGAGPARLEPGWVSVEYGVRSPAPVVVAEAQGNTDADLVTLLAARSAGLAPTLRSVDVSAGVVVVDHPDGTTDHLSWRHPTAEVVWLRVAQDGSRKRTVLREDDQP
ncbi:MAG TPA: alginate lyase family protein [Nocardioidaceae bacterium]|nr:alginate lyase family protein [Nocardioidaceae bacterium]